MKKLGGYFCFKKTRIDGKNKGKQKKSSRKAKVIGELLLNSENNGGRGFIWGSVSIVSEILISVFGGLWLCDIIT